MVNILFRWCLLSLMPLLSLVHRAEPDSSKTMHPFYVSVIEINHNAKEKTAEIGRAHV